MANDCSNSEVLFDQYATTYEAALVQSLAVSGEDQEFFAKGRVRWLAKCLRELKEHPHSVLDFGCGVGSSSPHLLSLLGAHSLLGIDVSHGSLEEARRRYGSSQTTFHPPQDYDPDASIDLAYCNGVFHHIPVNERAEAASYVYRALRPGGLFAFWENNPWNPGTRYVMSRCAFDCDAIPLSCRKARRLLRACGFSILRTDFAFIFPHPLKWLRPIEPLVSRLPLGAQYQVLCQKLS